MATTTIRVNARTHAILVELASAAEQSIQDTVGDAAEALRRQRFGRQVAAEFDALRQDEVAWADYLADVESVNVSDGLD